MSSLGDIWLGAEGAMDVGDNVQLRTTIKKELYAPYVFVGALDLNVGEGLYIRTNDYYARVRRVLTAQSLGAALAATVVLAVLVNVVELLCTAGLPAVYTRVLTLHDLPAWRYYGYIALYNLAYVADDGLMVAIAVVTLSRRKLDEAGGRWLKLVSGLVMLILGVLLIARPEWLR